MLSGDTFLSSQNAAIENGEDEVVVDAAAVFAECVDEVQNSDDNLAQQATVDFLNSMLGEDSKVGDGESCLMGVRNGTEQSDVIRLLSARHCVLVCLVPLP